MDDVRSRVKKRRDALSINERMQKSKVICEHLQDFLQGVVGSYRAFGSEVDLSFLDTSKLTLCLPVCHGDTMEFYQVDAQTQYEKGAYGIWEPQHAKHIAPDVLDIILVPLVAFDENCNRMGHGKGYYDRYLPMCRAMSIGIAFECQKDTLTLHAQDVPLDQILTEKQVYKRR